MTQKYCTKPKLNIRALQVTINNHLTKRSYLFIMIRMNFNCNNSYNNVHSKDTKYVHSRFDRFPRFTPTANQSKGTHAYKVTLTFNFNKPKRRTQSRQCR